VRRDRVNQAIAYDLEIEHHDGDAAPGRWQDQRGFDL
jgi:hypothetical protein